jgi:hypothetical protein
MPNLDSVSSTAPSTPAAPTVDKTSSRQLALTSLLQPARPSTCSGIRLARHHTDVDGWIEKVKACEVLAEDELKICANTYVVATHHI